MNKYFLGWFIVWAIILLASTQLDVIGKCIGIDSTYQHSITIEIFGSGIIAFIISFLTIRFQRKLEESTQKSKAENYFEGWLKRDINECFLRGHSTYNFSDPTNKFYFGNSFINSIYDKYFENKEYIWEMHDYLLSNKKFVHFENIVNEIRLAYIKAEKLENLFKKSYREKYNIDRGNGVSEVQFYDGYIYFRCKLYIPERIEECDTYIVKSQINSGLYNLNNKEDFAKEINSIKADRDRLIKEIEKLEFELDTKK